MSQNRRNSLTPRELQVAGLVREGLTDRDIADRLFITQRTAEWHVEQILNKLGFNSRAQVAAWVAGDSASGSRAAPSLHNLPLRLNAFVGRAHELAEIESLLDQRRLLTLTGVGGSGKTRLALEVASRSLGTYVDGACFADLTPVSDGQYVARAVAAALGVSERPRKPVIQTLVEHLHTRRLLLVLDNCEHVVDECARVVDTLLRACPGIKVLTTSREPLHLDGEMVWSVPPMQVPDPMATIDVDAVAACDAVALFMDRAQLVAPGFRVRAENASAVARLCIGLDGIPLALELAAARVGTMAPAQILDRLDDRFGLLTGRNRSAPARHWSLRSALDWSHDLLGAEEQRLFRRLSVFAGTFSLEAVGAVCSGSDLAVGASAELLGSLVDKSLVSALAASHDRMRFRLLDTIRQFGDERLTQSGEQDFLRRRHAEFFLALAETAFPNLRGHEQRDWRLRIIDEIDNLRAAFSWTLSHQPEAALRLAYSLTPFWTLDGSVVEGEGWLDAALNGYLNRDQLRASALLEGGWNSSWCGDMDGAAVRWQEAFAISQELGDPKGIGQALSALGWSAQWQGDWKLARDRYVEGLVMSRRGGDAREIAISAMQVGTYFHRRGDRDNARLYLRESLSLMEPLGDLRLRSYPLTYLSWIATETGEYQTARALAEEGLGIGITLDFQLGIAAALVDLAVLAAAQSRTSRALRLAAAAEATYESLASSRFEIHEKMANRWLERSRHEAGPELGAVYWAEGRAMSQSRAIEYALANED